MTSPVQTAFGLRSSGGSNLSVAATLSAPSTAGNTLVATAVTYSSNGFATSDTLTDNAGNAWTQAIVGTDTQSYAVWICSGAKAASTFTLTTANADTAIFRVTEWPGALQIPSTPSTAQAEGHYNGGSTTPGEPGVVAVAAGSVIVSEVVAHSGTVPTLASSDFTLVGTAVQTSGSLMSEGQAYKVEPTAGATDTPSWTFQAFKDENFLVFQLVPAGGGSTRNLKVMSGGSPVAASNVQVMVGGVLVQAQFVKVMIGGALVTSWTP
jgi:hypothetical protein